MSEAMLDETPPNAPIRRAMTPVSGREGLVFRGTPTPWTGAYGGDLMSHCIGAARHGRKLGRLISANFEFLRASDPLGEVSASTETVREGRSLRHIRVTLDQAGSEKLTAILVYETDSAATDVPVVMPPSHEAPRTEPGDIPSIADAELENLPDSYRTYYAATRGLDVRYITKPPFATCESGDLTESRFGGSENWTRVVEPADPGRAFSEAALCYIADDSALEPVLNGQGVSWFHDDAKFVTLSHSMRFVERIESGEWLSCTNRLHVVSGRYVETRGTITTSSGRRVASTRQLGIKVGHA
ncbi:acyl-CoA thioesterase [Brevibacterium jeotgali]|uniref:Acyl-CoA thioesterase n=1 Tax=Brevibacterium jeotgali TaxID=1262550 RepID=A0A2H1L6W3_9MICO|nr:thioesterase family protein [Brevibacterium jeotgali]TWC02317.1 acyl-CoA thioesterase [Brevibacterium jeotgali]SMY12631.1 Acyl-CoA thioesterase [Brevibacterium jeotgali]